MKHKDHTKLLPFHIMKKLNYLKMLEEVCELVRTDFCEGMSYKAAIPNTKPFTQGEAKEMAGIIARVYLIAHGINCSCGDKYKI